MHENLLTNHSREEAHERSRPSGAQSCELPPHLSSQTRACNVFATHTSEYFWIVPSCLSALMAAAMYAPSSSSVPNSCTATTGCARIGAKAGGVF